MLSESFSQVQRYVRKSYECTICGEEYQTNSKAGECVENHLIKEDKRTVTRLD